VAASPSPAILVLAVTTTTGQVIRHAYQAPESKKGMSDLVARTTARIDDAFNPATPRGFVLENPVVIYNLDHVVSITIDGLSDHELSDIAQKTRQKLGFRADM
jgi:hypothetical protein